jgi:hypothetical protein
MMNPSTNKIWSWASNVNLVFGTDYHCYCCDALVAVTGRVKAKPQWAECDLYTWAMRLPWTLRRKGSWATQGNLWAAGAPWRYCSFLGCCDKAPQTGDLHNRNVFCCTCGISEWKIKLWGFNSLVPLSLSCRRSSSPCDFAWSFLCTQLCSNFLLHKDTSHVRLGPTLMILF